MNDLIPDSTMDPMGHEVPQKLSAGSLSRGAASSLNASPVLGKKARTTPGRGAAGPIGASPKHDERRRSPRRVPKRLTFEEPPSGGSGTSESTAQAPSPAATVAYAPDGTRLGAGDQGTRSRPALPTVSTNDSDVALQSALAEIERLRGATLRLQSEHGLASTAAAEESLAASAVVRLVEQRAQSEMADAAARAQAAVDSMHNSILAEKELCRIELAQA